MLSTRRLDPLPRAGFCHEQDSSKTRRERRRVRSTTAMGSKSPRPGLIGACTDVAGSFGRVEPK